MKRIALLFALLACAADAAACSLILSGEFRVSRRMSTVAPSAVTVRASSVEPWVEGCDAGIMVVQLAGKSRALLMRQGYEVRPLSGVRAEDVFPPGPLAPQAMDADSVSLSWGWHAITPDDDGHVRLRFQIVPVSRSGSPGAAIEVCASTDDSVPCADPMTDDISQAINAS
ncbi:MAG: hypothetical protein JNM58_11280 [Xanthomonadaceae bacterium]|nr:hypothetical protein [Xanthomonadaceae bacterium]